MAPRTLLIPSLLDDWFPLLRHAFASDRWDPVLLTEANPQLAELGLRMESKASTLLRNTGSAEWT